MKQENPEGQRVAVRPATHLEHPSGGTRQTFAGHLPPSVLRHLGRKAFRESDVRVDEKGTKAARIVSAADGGGIQTPSAQITVDRPFAFAILRPGYLLPLFIGTVNEPAISP